MMLDQIHLKRIAGSTLVNSDYILSVRRGVKGYLFILVSILVYMNTDVQYKRSAP